MIITAAQIQLLLSIVHVCKLHLLTYKLYIVIYQSCCCSYYYHFADIMQDNLHWLASPVKNWRILVDQSFTAHMPLLIANQHIQIRKKALGISSTVTCTIFVLSLMITVLHIYSDVCGERIWKSCCHLGKATVKEFSGTFFVHSGQQFFCATVYMIRQPVSLQTCCNRAFHC